MNVKGYTFPRTLKLGLIVLMWIAFNLHKVGNFARGFCLSNKVSSQKPEQVRFLVAK